MSEIPTELHGNASAVVSGDATPVPDGISSKAVLAEAHMVGMSRCSETWENDWDAASDCLATI